MPNQFTNKAYLLIGGNLGDRIGNLFLAIEAISHTCGKVTEQSQVYETAAWGKTDQPDFLNQLLLIETILSPEELLQSVLEIETKLGRKRELRFGARTIDIDILYYADLIIESPELVIPHPRIAERLFTLVPLMELAPDLIDPRSGCTIAGMLHNCNDTLSVSPYSPNVQKNEG
jgi:2-amino-4-hydroxy-6-hydroxymethyldihydropteridine diphosphokinase